MSYASNMERKHGTIASSAADPMTWDTTSEQGRGVLVFTCTASVATTLHIRRAKTLAELDAPPESLHHEHLGAVAANTTLPVLVAHDSSLPHGRAWVEGGSGNYSLAGSRRAHS